ncbi:hypothetical protein KGF56_001469 [Candida oxycetoniae]|uniref:SH3 domain-containing protein n=1 Tax=Candida oxycetoniae TaxID=497107 RepID=A0AAI9SZH0_9ASCO|nr:uncharacterized protein KGF56_001469 [Candida oxycetoniae]KAI3405862.2 hypothetical protein KGF56_001469 [Candida oxycetoniae]
MAEPQVPFKVKAIFDYKSDYEDDLNFTTGQIITVTAIENEEWFTGEYDNKTGMFPKNFVEILLAPQIPVSNRPVRKQEPKQEPKEEVPKREDEGASAIDNQQTSSTGQAEPPSAPSNASGFTGQAEPPSAPSNASVSTGQAEPPSAPSDASGSLHQSKTFPTKHAPMFKSEEHHSPMVPMPHTSSAKPADPYSIKKQFVAASPSSYVPKIKPRDDSRLVAHPVEESKPAEDIVRSSTFEDHRKQEEEEAGPKVSLKERIALLQKKQQEEAEREAAALKRKEERKQKHAEEKERLKHLKEQKSHETQPGDAAIDSAGVAIGEPGSEQPFDHAVRRFSNDQKLQGNKEKRQLETGEDDQREGKGKGVGEGEEGYIVGQQGEEEEEEEEKNDDNNDDEDDEDEDEDEEDEDDEELKRRKLVERMAKISGGRNMFGMMGMPQPFGAGIPSDKVKKTKAPKKANDNKTEEEKKEEENHILDQQIKSPPLVEAPFPDVPNRVPTLDPEQHSIPSIDQNPQPKFTQESSSMAEDDEPSDSDQAEVITRNDISDSYQQSHVNISDSGADEHGENSPIRLKKNRTMEVEGTGYEADEDLSDIAKSQEYTKLNATTHSSHPTPDRDSNGTNPLPNEQYVFNQSAPHPPTHQSPTTKNAPPLGSVPPVPHVPPAPPVHAVPPIPPVPASPRVRQREHPPPPPIPQHARAPPPPIPGSSPPSRAPTNVSIASPSHLQDVPSVHSHRREVRGLPSKPGDDDDDDDGDDDDDDDNNDYDNDNNDDVVAQNNVQGFSSFEKDEESEVLELVNDYSPKRQIPRSQTLGSVGEQHQKMRAPPPPPPIPGSNAPPPIPIGEPPKRAATDHFPPLMQTSTGASVGSLHGRKSTESGVTRTRSLKGSEQNQAETALEQLDFEIANIKSTSTWWLKNELPESLTSKIGVDLIYEIDSNRIHKRGGRIINYRDYYILFYDLSQLVFELEFEEQDPKNTIHLVNQFVKPSPPMRKDLLDIAHKNFGPIIVNLASQLVGKKLEDKLVNFVFESNQLKHKIISPIGNKSFGVTIYKNFNNSNVSKIDDIKSGDILWIKNGKFDSHKSLMGNKSVTLGDCFTGVIYDFDPNKDKFKVFEQDSSGVIKKESYKIGNLKSGKIRVFRPIPKEYVGL